MKSDHKRAILVMIPLVILVLFSFYSSKVDFEENPPTVEILDNPAKYENQTLEMRGFLEDYEIKNGTLNLTLERYDRTYRVIYQLRSSGEFEDIYLGDVFDLSGVCKLSSNGYVEALELGRRPSERHNRLFTLSILGIGFILVVLVVDRETLKEVIPIG